MYVIDHGALEVLVHNPARDGKRRVCCVVVQPGAGRYAVVSCRVAWRAEGAVTKRQWPDGVAHGKMQAGRAVCLSAHCVWCVCAPVAEGHHPLRGWAASVLGCPGDALLLCLMLLLKVSLGPALGASGLYWGIDDAGT